MRKLVVAIHDLNPWGGQDKSNLEILFHANSSVPVELHACSFVDSRAWPKFLHILYNLPRKPIFIKSLFYSILATFRLRRYGNAKKRRSEGIVIQTTGTASPVADVVQVQFIHKTWLNILKQHSFPESENFIKNTYHSLMGIYNVLSEELFFTPEKKYVAISHAIKKELIENFDIPPQNIETIYHGVDGQHFFPYQKDIKAFETRQFVRRQLGIQDDDVALLHVGALNHRKGIFNSLKALGHLKKNGITNVHLIAVGDGDKKNLTAFAQRENIADNLKIVSHSKNVRDYYWASDIFYFPSIYEPFGLVILEAMACGMACLVSGHAGGTELIRDKENGLIIENIFNHESMAQELNTLIKDSELRKKIASGARATAEQHDWRDVAQKYVAYYTSVFSK